MSFGFRRFIRARNESSHFKAPSGNEAVYFRLVGFRLAVSVDAATMPRTTSRVSHGSTIRRRLMGSISPPIVVRGYSAGDEAGAAVTVRNICSKKGNHDGVTQYKPGLSDEVAMGTA